MGNAINLTGQRFGMLTAIKRDGSAADGKAAWECACDCGKTTIVSSGNLHSGHTKSCGCLRKRGGRKADFVGQKFGRLTVMEKRNSTARHKDSMWLCHCECGNTLVVGGCNLRQGHTQSCGCLKLEKSTKHGKYRTSEYRCWESMRQRCYNPKCARYPDWGGRGITVCEHWLCSFENFFADMGEKPGKEYSLDRIDVNGNYEPSNCRWATKKEQANNKRPRKKNNRRR